MFSLLLVYGDLVPKECVLSVEKSTDSTLQQQMAATGSQTFDIQKWLVISQVLTIVCFHS